MVTMSVAGIGSFQCFSLVVQVAGREIWDCINFIREWKESCRVCLSREERVETW
jgi:hypothetical protein